MLSADEVEITGEDIETQMMLDLNSRPNEKQVFATRVWILK